MEDHNHELKYRHYYNGCRGEFFLRRLLLLLALLLVLFLRGGNPKP